MNFSLSLEIVTWRFGGFAVAGHIAINDVLKNFPVDDNNRSYQTKSEAIAVAQKYYVQELVRFMPNLALEENIKPLPFKHDYVELDIHMSLSPNQEYICELREFIGLEKYVIIDKLHSTISGYDDVIKLIIANNLILSCNKCKYITNNISNSESIRVCGNQSSIFYGCVMDLVDDGCNSFQAIL